MIKRSAPLKRSPVKRKARKRKPDDDAKYLAFVRGLPCLVCFPLSWCNAISEGDCVFIPRLKVGLFAGQQSRSEAAHLGKSTSRRGLSQKYPDNETGALCHEHHQLSKDSHHAGTKTFWQKHAWMDRDKVIETLQRLYREECGK